MSSLIEVSGIEFPAKRRNTSPAQDEELFTVTMHDVVSATSEYLQGVLSNVRDHVQSWRRTHKPAGQSQQDLLQDSAPWLQQLISDGYKQVMDHDALTAKNSLMPLDHLFRALASNDMVQDFRVLMCQKPSPSVPTTDSSPTPVPPLSVVTVWQLGSNVCGHAGIVHGGMTAAMIDETYGYLLYLAKFQGLLDFKAVVTASLEVSYKMPLLPHKPVCVTTWVSSMQGRKIWLESVVSEKPLIMREQEDGTWRPMPESATAEGGQVAQVYATSQALFVVPRADGASSARLAEASKGRTDTLDAIKPTMGAQSSA